MWHCINCGSNYNCQTRHRLTNRSRALAFWTAIRNDWKETDVQLDLLVKAGQPSGCQLVHSSVFNWHLEKLILNDNGMGKKLTTWDIKYHASEARKDLERAKEFVRSKQ